MAKQEKTDSLLCCSFCGKSQHEVKKLIAGPSVFICDECIELCNDIIPEECRKKTRTRLHRPSPSRSRSRTSSTST
ncbi:MAG: hypothetical protein MPW14_14880 [Candidatus Manganitrophus sp.]|nr:MAG: hypothetical protein MPW14_14880 [Candidatus Manganitrophus sp.]